MPAAATPRFAPQAPDATNLPFLHKRWTELEERQAIGAFSQSITARRVARLQLQCLGRHRR